MNHLATATSRDNAAPLYRVTVVRKDGSSGRRVAVPADNGLDAIRVAGLELEPHVVAERVL